MKTPYNTLNNLWLNMQSNGPPVRGATPPTLVHSKSILHYITGHKQKLNDIRKN